MKIFNPYFKILRFDVKKLQNEKAEVQGVSTSSIGFSMKRNESDGTGAINVMFEVAGDDETGESFDIEIRVLTVFSEFGDRPKLDALIDISETSVNIMQTEIQNEAKSRGFNLNAGGFLSEFKREDVAKEIVIELNRVFPPRFS